MWFCGQKKIEGKSKTKEREKKELKNHLHMNNDCGYMHSYYSNFAYEKCYR